MSPSLRSESGPGESRARLLLPLLLLVLGWACGPPRERFQNSHDSPRAVTQAFLQALEAEDRGRLASLALTRREFVLEVFPEMPTYGNIPPDFAWSQLQARNRYGLSSVLEAHGGRDWQLEGITFHGARTVYQTFMVHREPMLLLRDRDSGETKVAALFGSLLEHEGGFKLFSFNIDR